MIYSSRHVSPNPEIKPHRYLGTYPIKVRCAWTEVSVDTCPSRASVMAPGGRDLEQDLRDSVRGCWYICSR